MAANKSTNISSSSNSSTFLLIEILEKVDDGIRVTGFVVHLLYFAFVFLIKDLRMRSLIYIHQVNLFGLIFIGHYAIYLNAFKIDILNINASLCTISEIVWAMAKYLRCYSILLLGIYRMIAVLSPRMFNKWLKSTLVYMLSFLIEFLVCSCIYLIGKFTFRTTYGVNYCQDGYSRVIADGWYYFLFTSTIGVILPSFAVIVIYFVTKHAIDKQIMLKANKKDSSTTFSSLKIFFSGLELLSKDGSKVRLSPQESLIRQLFIINILLTLSSTLYLGLNLANLFQEYLTNNYYSIRLIITISCLFIQSIIPVVSLSSHPKFKMILILKQFKQFLQTIILVSI